MNQFKRAKVVMLFSSRNSGCLTQNKHSLKLDIGSAASTADNRHLYIISDDEIKEGDWVICKFLIGDVYEINPCFEYKLIQVGKITDDIIYNKENNFKIIKSSPHYFCKKIIATTDTSLKLFIDGNGNKSSYELTKSGYIEFLPQPSEQFIEKYIKEYNKGNIITDVMVEYEEDRPYEDNEFVVFYDNVKINPKDNTITIKKLKDNYSKEEVIELIYKYCKEMTQCVSEEDEKWIEENL